MITHGTNTLEETAWLLHLVVAERRGRSSSSGAMRPASALSGDGPLNVVSAVRVAAVAGGPRPRRAGRCSTTRSTRARSATKSRHDARRTRSRDGAGGPLGWVDGDGRVVLDHAGRRARPRCAARSPASTCGAQPRVDVVVTYLGADGALIDAAVAAGARGIVSAGTGAGYPTPREVEALERGARRRA